MNNRPLHLKLAGFLLEIFKTIAFVVVLAFVIRYFLIQPFIVEGNSMEPHFHNRQFILIDKLSYRLRDPHRGDVIVFENPRDPRVFFIKRIIGLPGETVTIKDDHVYINDQLLSEPYLPSGIKTYFNNPRNKTTSTRLFANEYYVMGDNRPQSSDSREWGVLKKINMVGRYWVTLFPKASNPFANSQSAPQFVRLIP